MTAKGAARPAKRRPAAARAVGTGGRRAETAPGDVPRADEARSAEPRADDQRAARIGIAVLEEIRGSATWAAVLDRIAEEEAEAVSALKAVDINDGQEIMRLVYRLQQNARLDQHIQGLIDDGTAAIDRLQAAEHTD